ncbi:hypothetical protein Mal4_11410 [Maioricimonas rarisocia]|uniref:DUF4258 domain-containing protein n=1 Tax=Maioricimonas rarisocia TaxID=2528026 RepID=A0A517Z301_9PLAN|nr:hypothetical protein [Maioricimonas rarisocia]QDU36841.1 hypothetical protein Mal4_11410 [Maioricimonas rarisocia]
MSRDKKQGHEMGWTTVVWNDDPQDGNIEHVEQHGLTVEEVEHVLSDFDRMEVSRRSGLPIIFGFLPDGRRVAVVIEEFDDSTVYPVTAFEVRV